MKVKGGQRLRNGTEPESRNGKVTKIFAYNKGFSYQISFSLLFGFPDKMYFDQKSLCGVGNYWHDFI